VLLSVREICPMRFPGQMNLATRVRMGKRELNPASS
jgi:hypothetical protein